MKRWSKNQLPVKKIQGIKGTIRMFMLIYETRDVAALTHDVINLYFWVSGTYCDLEKIEFNKNKRNLCKLLIGICFPSIR